MNVIPSPQDLKLGCRRACLAIGFFDGVHLGHQHILRQTINDARQHNGVAVVITFNNHPNTVVAPTRVPPLIYSLPQKLRTIETVGVTEVVLIQFDKAFSQIDGEAFVLGLARDLHPIGSVCVGSNFTFGYKRSGNVELLRRLGAKLNFAVHAVAAVSLDGKVVSSTRIREAIQSGDLDSASQMLGRTYALSGQVVRGDGVGRSLGFPTANLDVPGLVLPPAGVYAVHAEVDGSRHRGVLNLGHRPTVQPASPQLRVEAHLLDFSADLYGKTLEVSFLQKLRDEKRFGSLADLQGQIARDIATAKALF